MAPKTAFVIDGADIRERLRADHQRFLGELDGACADKDERRCQARVRQLRRAWMIHALTQESVVYRALEGADATASSGNQADQRFLEHELVETLLETLSEVSPKALEWQVRMNVVRRLIQARIDAEQTVIFPLLAERFDAGKLRQLGEQFAMARGKLTLLEELKAA